VILRGRERGRTGSGAPRLFAPQELRFRRTGQAELADLARRRWLPPTAREKRGSEDRAALEKLRSVATELGASFGLGTPRIEPERDGIVAHYGICYEDGRIRIRLRHATTGRLLKESSLVDTLCHELAHLRHFDHSPRFKAFYLRILEEARRCGFYRPGPEPDRARQGSLFETADCGTARRG